MGAFLLVENRREQRDKFIMLTAKKCGLRFFGRQEKYFEALDNYFDFCYNTSEKACSMGFFSTK